MVTTGTRSDVTAVTTSRAVMMSALEIAQRDGVSRPGVSRTIKHLIADHGLDHERDTRGRVAKVNVAQYDHLREKFGNAIRAQMPRSAPSHGGELPLPGGGAIAPAGDSLDAAQTRRAHIEAERAAIRLAEDRGELVRKAGLIEAVTDAGMAIARVIDRLPQAADDLAAAVGRDGPHGARHALKSIAHNMREEIANALANIAGASPEFENEPDDGSEGDM